MNNRSNRLPAATVVITTKNRKAELREALLTVLRQTVRCEVLVIDDGSTDGTADLVRVEFPTVRLHREEVSRGLIVRRNQAARLAAGEVIVSLDDDILLRSPDTLEQTLRDFDDDRIGAVTIPFINVRQSPQVLDRSPAPGRAYVTDSFRGGAHALRRRLFLETGGYREFLFHQGEESDLCIRLLDRGYLVRLGSAEPMHHLESPRRDSKRIAVYGPRNLVLFTWYNVPQPYFWGHLPVTSWKALRHGFRRGQPGWTLQGLGSGYLSIARQLRARRPVRPATYTLFRELRKRKAIPLESVCAALSSASRHLNYQEPWGLPGRDPGANSQSESATL